MPRSTTTAFRTWYPALAVALLLLLAHDVQAQDSDVYTITGRVVDEALGDALPGVNIRFRDTAIGTATNLNGRFTLEGRVEPGTYTLQFSFIGYQTIDREVTLADEPQIELGTIEMVEDIARAEEVIVTGTAAPTERKQLGNAVSSVDARDIEQAASPAVDRALQGKIAGAYIQQNSGNPAAGISVRLRGTSTVLGSAEPLYIVDGIIVNNDSPGLIDLGGGAQNRLVDLDPNDIERIEVVKGAAAAALYGSQANNGVVQIFTKRGQMGVPRVTFTTRVQTDAVRRTLDTNEYPFTAPEGDPDRAPVDRFDFQDYIFQRAWGTEQYLSVSGGAEGTRFYTSGSHYVTEGVVRGNQFRRLNGRVRLEQILTDWANVSVGANYTRSVTNDVPNGGLTSNYGALTGFIFGPNTFDPRPDALGNYPNQGTLANPIEVIDEYDFAQETGRFLGDAKLNLVPVEGMNVDYTLGIDTYDQTATAFIPRGTSAPGLASGFSRRSTRNFLQINNDLRGSYRFEPSASVVSTTTLGATMQYENVETFSAQSENLAPVTEVVQSGTVSRDFGEFRDEVVIYGFFGQETVGIADLVYLTVAGRVDASSVFAADNRWQFYQKASGSYVISDHAFWQGDEQLRHWLSSFKLRASYGTAGGLTAIDPYERFTNFSPQSYLGLPGVVPSTQLGTIDLVPERQREFEVGADLGFLDDRLAMELTYYDQKTEDLLLSRQLAPTSGFLTQLQNVGELQNEGFELLARALPLRSDDFRWTSTLTFATNESQVTGIQEEDNPEGILILGGFGLVAAIEGQTPGVFFGSAYRRADDDGDIYIEDSDGPVVNAAGQALVEDGDYFRCADDAPDDCIAIPARADGNRILGNPEPDFTASWINEFTFNRRLTLRMQWDAVVGQDVFNFTRRLAALGVFGTLEDYELELRGELPQGYNAATFSTYERWVEDGSFIKLRELALSYTFYPAAANVSSVRLSAVGRNLLSFDGYSGYDPETNVGGQRTNVRNFDFVEVPIPRTFSLGATINF